MFMHTCMNMHAHTLPWATRMETTQGGWQDKTNRSEGHRGQHVTVWEAGVQGRLPGGASALTLEEWGPGSLGVKIMKNFWVDRRTRGGF